MTFGRSIPPRREPSRDFGSATGPPQRSVWRRAGSLLQAAVRLGAADMQAFPTNLVINVFAASPLTPRPVRVLLYRLFGMDVRTLNIQHGCKFKSAKVVIGRRSFVNEGCIFDNEARVVIGEECAVSMGVLFCTSSHVLEPHRVRAGTVTQSPISVGKGTWIGARATLLPGVRIGEGCVIAAGAVVVASCPDDGLYAGVPARLVRSLKSELP